MYLILKINLKTFTFIIIFFSLLEPDYFSSIPFIHNYYVVMRVITLFIAIIFFIIKKRFPTITFIIIIYFIVYGFSTYQNDGSILDLLGYSTYIISFVAWSEIVLRFYTIKGLYSLNFVYSSLVYINTILYLLFPNGYTQSETYAGNIINRYFLGVENQFAATLIPAIMINVIYNYTKYGRLKINSYILITVVLFTFLYVSSATSIVGIFLIIFYLLFISRSNLKNLINNINIIVSVASLYLIIVVFNSLEIFSFIIEEILKKDLTLSTRTLLWDRAFIYIKESPIIGYGYLGGGKYLQVTSTRSMDSHNTILQFLLQHGILGIGILFILLFIFFRNISKNKKNKINLFILYSFFVASIMMISEVYSFTFILIIIILGIFSPYIVKEQEKILSKG